MTKRLQVYESDDITVTFDPNVCIHSAVCVRSLPTVFDVRRQRWVELEHASADAVASVVARCPTGALQSRQKGAASDTTRAAAPPAVSITPSTDGPLLVSGPVRIVGPDGQVIREDDRIALCRCGGTGNPPFCDGSHRRNGFRPAR